MTEKERLEQAYGPLMYEHVFTGDKAFAAFEEAVTFCKERDFSVGRMQREAPVGVKKGDWDIQKWRNLDFEDKKLMDGFIVGLDKRNGPVGVLLFADPDA